MSAWMLAIASGLYLLAALDYARQGNSGFAIAFLAYAVANAGFVIASRP